MTIKIEGLDKVLKKLDSLGKPSVFNTPMKQSLYYLERKLKREVPKAPGAFSELATDAQRRAYWYKVSKKPSLHGPGGYQRTHDTSRGWTTKISNGGRRGLIDNQMPGAPYVYGAPDQRPWAQQPFHARSGWPRIDKVAKEATPKIIKFFQQAYDKALNK